MSEKKYSGGLLTYLSRGVKVIGDRLMAATLLLIFSPILVVVAILVRVRMGSPIVFSQARPGKNGQIFTVYKFRTMTGDCDPAGNLLSDEQRLIPLGQFLRKASLDELPQLWSILKGDMSLVGPRPALFNQADLIDLRTSAGVHSLRPGLTGWAQIHGRDELPIPQKVELDVYYLQNRSFLIDLEIILKTIAKVLRADGVRH